MPPRGALGQAAKSQVRRSLSRTSNKSRQPVAPEDRLARAPRGAHDSPPLARVSSRAIAAMKLHSLVATTCLALGATAYAQDRLYVLDSSPQATAQLIEVPLQLA